MEEINSEDVVYSDGTYSVVWSVTPTSPVQMDDGYGNIVRTSTLRKDYIGHTSALVLNGAEYLPQKGDSLTRADGEVYKVVAEGEEGRCWEYISDIRDRIRVKCVRVVV
jgi:hypothetical protein